MTKFVRLGEVSTFLTHGWYTRGRVVRVDSCRPYENSRGKGFVCSFAIADDKDRMECVAFGEHAQKLSAKLSLDQVFNFRAMRVSKRKENYSHASAPYQLIVQDLKQITQASEEEAKTCVSNTDIDVNLVDYSDLCTATRAHLKLGWKDLLGILIGRDERATVTCRSTGAEMLKSSITLEDESGRQVAITLWGEQVRQAEDLTLLQPILVLDVHGETQGEEELSLASQNSTTFHLASSCPEGQALLTDYRNADANQQKKVLTTSFNSDQSGNTPHKLVSAIALAVRQRVETEYFRIIAIVTRLPYSPNFYLRCPASKCGAKVQRTLLGRYDCTKCQATTTTPSIGLTLVLEIQDYSGSAMITVFNESAAVFADRSLPAAKQLHDQDQDEFSQLLNSRRFIEFDFRVSVSKNYAGIFSGRCWSLRSITENEWERLLIQMQKDNDLCVVSRADSLPSTSDSLSS